MAPTQDLYDVVVIGGGPAGLTAGLYLARARYRVLVVEKDDFGGQITITNEVVNYPGVASASGRELTATMRRQAADFGAEFLSAEVTGLDLDGDVKTVRTSRGDLRCFGVLVATGANPRRLGFDGEAEYAGRGVAYCATCDGEFFTGREVLVVGGGFAAAEEAVFLTKYASHVTILVREDDFTCDASVAAPAKADPKIDVRYHTVLDGVTAGQGGLTEARIRDVETGETSVWTPADGGTFGVFVFAGYVPATALVKGLVELDDAGYVVTDQYGATSVPGVYAAGDLRVKHLRQVVTAVSDGAVAAVELERWAKQMSERTGLVPPRPVDTAYERREAEAAKAAAGTTPAPAPARRSDDAKAARKPGELFNENVRQQLAMVFGRLARPVTLRLELDGTPLSAELEGFVTEMAKLSDGKVTVERAADAPADENGRAVFDADDALPAARPCVRVCVPGDDGGVRPTGLAFHGVPSGHEFNSFVLGLYNAAGPGQQVDADSAARIAAIDGDVEVMLLVSLTCTMCPDTVLAAQRIAAGNAHVRAEAYDVAHFPELKDRYGVMSVPCIVIRHGSSEPTVEFGKKNVAQMLDLIGA
ncbi:FAD-dependent oxidoreductase [Bifidobacterium pullorum subsp. saeculare]|uniref:FAD-dependent oxidoreductase n=1 Tax=Bifidobacterium pullorum subsp. saeculare TaxID=78257 RepID=A0A938WXH8_9BIFI|nr:FAD-dependent oxidoreductase [Bifidobacterium pullorum]MBM6699089.1 FAD-dependent oxidoreductase [Bifidobacterium pullorum subsp. saeculare]